MLRYSEYSLLLILGLLAAESSYSRPAILPGADNSVRPPEESAVADHCGVVSGPIDKDGRVALTPLIWPRTPDVERKVLVKIPSGYDDEVISAMDRKDAILCIRSTVEPLVWITFLPARDGEFER